MPDPSLIENNTAEIRQLKRAQRRLLSLDTQRSHRYSLCRRLTRIRRYQNSRKIGVYLANDGEIDPAAIIEHAWNLQKEVYLPILSPLKNSLHFAPYTAKSILVLNRFNIPEPQCHPSKWKSAAQLDLLLLPLVAFDTSGNRIGMGGGFYDRTLAYLQLRQYWKKPVLVGLAHEIQKAGSLVRQNWDIPLDYIATENRLYHDKNRR